MSRGLRNRDRFWQGLGIVGILAALTACGGGGGGSTTGSTNGSTNGNTNGSTNGGTTGTPLTKAELGEALFFNRSLSSTGQMSCGTCHDPNRAFTDPRPGPTSQGAVTGRFGVRNSPSISYMAFSPDFNPVAGEGGTAIGGQFWDGRALNLPEQAKSPLLNPTEMNNASAADVVAKVKAGPLAASMKAVYGNSIFGDNDTAFSAVADAIATFERLPKVSPFSSKYDAFLKGQAQLSAAELRGLAAFNGKGACSGCHTSAPGPGGTPPLFTNFCYANLGLPKNPSNPFYSNSPEYNPDGNAFVDLGLKIATGRADDAGNFMTASLRNVAITAPYFHNGVFNTLEDVVKFYNSRDLGGFDAPEVPETENMTELGNLHLTAQEQSDIVAFLKTLTDGYSAPRAQFGAARTQGK